MKVTSVKIIVLKNTGNNLIGVAEITLGEMIVIHNIKILKKDENMFMAMPSKPKKSGGFEDIVHPINAMVRMALEGIIFNLYEACVNKDLGNTNFCISKDFKGTLLEQTYKDFTISEDDKIRFINQDDRDKILAWFNS